MVEDVVAAEIRGRAGGGMRPSATAAAEEAAVAPAAVCVGG